MNNKPTSTYPHSGHNNNITRWNHESNNTDTSWGNNNNNNNANWDSKPYNKSTSWGNNNRNEQYNNYNTNNNVSYKNTSMALSKHKKFTKGRERRAAPGMRRAPEPQVLIFHFFSPFSLSFIHLYVHALPRPFHPLLPVTPLLTTSFPLLSTSSFYRRNLILSSFVLSSSRLPSRSRLSPHHIALLISSPLTSQHLNPSIPLPFLAQFMFPIWFIAHSIPPPPHHETGCIKKALHKAFPDGCEGVH